MFKDAYENSSPMPVPHNPNGRTLTVDRFTSLCLDHKKAMIVEQGEETGWPNNVDFVGLPDRIIAHCHHLVEVIKSPAASFHYKQQLAQVKRTSTHHFESTSGAFSSFEFCQPG